MDALTTRETNFKAWKTLRKFHGKLKEREGWFAEVFINYISSLILYIIL
jgi:hypothetical protein